MKMLGSRQGTLHIIHFRRVFLFDTCVQPGSIFSIVRRQSSVLLMMDSTDAVQTKGRGVSFQASVNSWIAFWRSGTLLNAPLRTAFWVNSANQRSTRFNQLELVGIKCGLKRGCLIRHSCTLSSITFRVRAEITSAFLHPVFTRLWREPPAENPQRRQRLRLRFTTEVSRQIHVKPGAYLGNLFLREP